MKRTSTLVLVLAVSATTALAQMRPKPGAEHTRLQSLVGTWNVEAEEIGPDSLKYTLRDTCEWFDGGFHVVCRMEGTGDASRLKGQTIVGYDARAGAYTRYSHNSLGNATSMKGTVSGTVWTWNGEVLVNGATMKLRVTGREESPTAQSYKVEGSMDGADWFVVEQGRSTKLQ